MKETAEKTVITNTVTSNLWAVCTHVQQDPTLIASRARLRPAAPVAGEVLCQSCLEHTLDVRRGVCPHLELLFESQLPASLGVT